MLNENELELRLSERTFSQREQIKKRYNRYANYVTERNRDLERNRNLQEYAVRSLVFRGILEQGFVWRI